MQHFDCKGSPLSVHSFKKGKTYRSTPGLEKSILRSRPCVAFLKSLTLYSGRIERERYE